MESPDQLPFSLFEYAPKPDGTLEFPFAFQLQEEAEGSVEVTLRTGQIIKTIQPGESFTYSEAMHDFNPN